MSVDDAVLSTGLPREAVEKLLHDFMEAHAPLVIDTRNACAGMAGKARVVKA